MRFECHTCGSGYRIPETTVQNAGRAGLKIRCKQCRAIMVVDARMALDDTAKELPTLRRGTPVALTDVHAAAHVDRPHPAVLNRRGAIAPLDGVSRQITGIRMQRRLRTQKRKWFAAIGGEARGPYTQTEMLLLAKQGRVRGSTLVWSPGFARWSRVRASQDEDKRLQWLRDAVTDRKHKERMAMQERQQADGINVILLNRPVIREAEDSAPPQHALRSGKQRTAPNVPADAAPTSGIWLMAVLAVLACVAVLYTWPALEQYGARVFMADLLGALFGVTP